MARWSRWVLAHKRSVVGFWIVVTVAGFAALGPATDALTEDFRPVPGREGSETNREIAARYGNGGDVVPIVPVVTLPKGTTVDSPAVIEELDAALSRVEEALPDARMASYASTGDRAFVSEDGRTTFALVYVPHGGGLEGGQEDAQLAQAALDGVTIGGVPVQVTGLDALRAAAGESEGTNVSVLAEVLVAGVGALAVLAFVFGSFMAILPLLMAAVAIPTTFLLVWPLAEVTDVSIAVQFLVALIGLGVAIDYSLLVVMRWREERQKGVSNEAAVERALWRAGSPVVFSGTTVAISLLALVVLPVPALRTIGIAGLLIALVSVAVATTLLPVLLATVGPRLDWPRLRRVDPPVAPGPRGPPSSSATAGPPPSSPPAFSSRSPSQPSRSSSVPPGRRRSPSPVPRAPGSSSSRTRGSARGRSPRSTRSCARGTPTPWPAHSPRSRASRAPLRPRTGAGPRRRSSRSSRPPTETRAKAVRR
jgi:putative drug exporter of the RND superfamily